VIVSPSIPQTHTRNDAPAECPGATACDLARQHLALEQSELRDYIASVSGDRDTYRELLQHALAGWHEARGERDRLRRRCRSQQDEIRALLGLAGEPRRHAA
jgi:hypothetical protein